MSPSTNRGRIRLRPLDTDPALALSRVRTPVPPGWTLRSEVGRDGWLMEHRSGRLAVLSPAGVVASIDQRKARAALDVFATVPPDEHDADDLAQALRAWRAEAGLTAAQASRLLGLPKSTYDFAEQGRGFRYPLLLMHAIRAFGPPTAD